MLATLAAVVLLLGLASVASAQVRDFRLGVSDGAVDPTTDVRTMGNLNVQTLRILFNWEQAEITPPTNGSSCAGATYGWTSYYDPLVREASDAGVRLLPMLVGSPDHVSDDPRNQPDVDLEGEIHAYRCFVRAAVERYGRGGTFILANPGVQPLIQWQVWNEPNQPQYNVNGGRIDPGNYAKVLKVASNQIRRTDPAATVVVAGIPENPTNGMNGLRYLRRLYQVPGIERYFDVVAIHPYAVNFRGVEGALIRLRGLLRDLGDRSRYVWVTEIGWGTHAQPGQQTFLEKTEAGQAQELGAVFNTLRDHRQRWNIGTVTWFRWRDTAAYSEDLGPFNYAGLFRRNGTFKPSCTTFINFTGGRCTSIASAARVAGSSLVAPPSGAADVRAADPE